MLPPYDVDHHRDIGSGFVKPKSIEPGQQLHSFVMKVLEFDPALFELALFAHASAAHDPRRLRG
jgi:hypothetical protein